MPRRNKRKAFERSCEVMRVACQNLAASATARASFYVYNDERDVERRITVEQVADDLSALADSVLRITAQWCWSRLKTRHRESPHFAKLKAESEEQAAREEGSATPVEPHARADALVDELLLYLAPRLLGAGRGIADFGPLTALADGLALEFKSVETLGADLRVVARVQPRRELFAGGGGHGAGLQRFQLLGRIDRRIVTSGQAELALAADTLTYGDVVMDLAAHRVFRQGHAVHLRPTEFRLLHFLMTHPERVHSRAQLLDRVWGDHVFIEERTVDVHIKRLREALGMRPVEIGVRIGAGIAPRRGVDADRRDRGHDV